MNWNVLITLIFFRNAAEYSSCRVDEKYHMTIQKLKKSISIVFEASILRFFISKRLHIA